MLSIRPLCSVTVRWRCRALLTFALHPVRLSACPVLQRDCEVEVQSVDRVGNFQGTVRFGKMNLGGERAHLPAVCCSVLQAHGRVPGRGVGRQAGGQAGWQLQHSWAPAAGYCP